MTPSTTPQWLYEEYLALPADRFESLLVRLVESREPDPTDARTVTFTLDPNSSLAVGEASEPAFAA